MKLDEVLFSRSNNKCELCQSEESPAVYEVLPQKGRNADNCLVACEKCRQQIDKKEPLDSKHWTCLSESMWSEVPAIQVIAWRMLNRLKNESWAQDNLDMLYLDEDTLNWAKALAEDGVETETEVHQDCNGQVLQTGDSVVLIKSLDVKGSSLNAKMGTVVKNIRLVENNSDQIEGKIEGQTIVILTKYVRKQG
jgi:protein PhnA